MTAPRREPTDREPVYTRSDNPSPVANIVAALDGGPYWMISEVSELTGVPVSTLRRWYNRGPDRGGTRAPSKVHHHMNLTINLYTEDDLAEIRARLDSPTTKDRKKR